MGKAYLIGETLKAASPGTCTVVSLSDYKRVSHRLCRFFRRRRVSFIWASIGVMLLAVMMLGAFSGDTILKGIAWVSVGIAFFLIAPFSWWLNGEYHSNRKGAVP